jgi:hypothetical protein
MAGYFFFMPPNLYGNDTLLATYDVFVAGIVKLTVAVVEDSLFVDAAGAYCFLLSYPFKVSLVRRIDDLIALFLSKNIYSNLLISILMPNDSIYTYHYLFYKCSLLRK